MRTRSQEYSQQVFEQIDGLNFATDTKENEKLKKQYGSLCHSFPQMVLRNGLSQAVAFMWVKSKDKPEMPHGKFLTHLAKLTKLNENPKAFQQAVNKADLAEYQRLTRKILAASIWYKRFAESLLDVKSGEQIEDIEEESTNGN